MSRSPSELRPAAFHILLALAPGPLHGLGIAKSIDRVTDGAMSLGPGTLYRSLKELRAEGLIEEVESADAGDPRRRTYRITDSGRTAATTEATRWARVVDLARDVLPDAP